MDNNKIQQQLTQWKNKYYQSITELDPHLSSLRKTLRKKDQEQHQIEHILEKIDETIIKMENNKNKPQTSGEILSELLSTLNLPKSHKKEARLLAKQFKSASHADINQLLPQLNSILDQCLIKNESEKSNGFSFGLFKNKQQE